jgi:choline-glycine betaine transporter
VMGAIAIIMLLVGDEGEALTGIQNITIIMAAPFAVVMVVLCVALAKDLRNDPLMLRDRRSAAAVEQAIEYGTKNYGDEFVVAVKPHRDVADDRSGPPAEAAGGTNGAAGDGVPPERT